MGVLLKDHTNTNSDQILNHGGSILDIAEGRDGKPIFLTQTIPKSKSEMACDIIKTPLIPTGGDIDPGIALTNVLSRIAQRRYEQIQTGLSLGRSQVHNKVFHNRKKVQNLEKTVS